MDVVQYKCPNCGANIEFSAEKSGFACQYCLSFFTEEEMKSVFERIENKPLDENAQKAAQEFEAHTNLYTCPNCAAEIISEDTTSATFCYYCHNPVILSGRLSGDYRPGKVIPFKIPREKALEIFHAWTKKKWFLPNDFTSEKQLEKMSSVYVPFWIADCYVDAKLDAIGKKVSSWTSGKYRYTRTMEYDVKRCAAIQFNGIPADGASKIDDELMEAIEPFDYSQLVPFSMSYLSGFFADKYDVDKAVVFQRIKNRAVSGSTRILNSSITGYSTFSTISSNYSILNTEWQYILLPVWFMTYNFKGKQYSFAINGQSGKLAGLPPLSMPKALRFAGILTAAITAVFGIAGFFV